MAGETCNHIRVKVVSRSAKGNAVAAAAYRSGQKLEDITHERTYDYSRKTGVHLSEILVPEHMKGVEWVYDRERLWNEVEAKENESKRSANARLFREVMIPLPHELSTEQRLELTRRYVSEQFTAQGMIADVSYHNMEGQDPKENAHAHIMLTMREVSDDGFRKKNREWDKKQNLELWREQWTLTANKMSNEWGQELGLDHRSYQERGIEKIPELHMGAAHAMEERGIKTERGDQNRAIQLANQELALRLERGQLGRENVERIATPKQGKKVAQEKSLEDKLDWHDQQYEQYLKQEQKQASLDRYTKYLMSQKGDQLPELKMELFAQEQEVTRQQQRDMEQASLHQDNTQENEQAQEQSMEDDYGMEM